MSADGWWKHGIIYQIYPRSFQDSNGDGVGDLPGIVRRLDYLADLGVDAVWISPFFPSPMADFGYDVCDYCAVDPLFGTLADFDVLIAAAHARGIRVILDFVPNHTSNRHPWFLESASSRTHPKRDWYLWRDPGDDGGPPNNWLGNFGGPAWTLDETTGQYYCHMFLKEQPDLNWRNAQVRTAMYDVLRFWLRRGVDGFRIDVLYHVIKDDRLRDNPSDPAWQAGQNPAHRLLPEYTSDQPEVQQIVREMRRVVDEFSTRGASRILIGELHLPMQRLVAYYGRNAEGVLEGLQMPFNFQLIRAPWDAREIDAIIREYEALLPAGAAPNWVLGNHDESRIASRVGEPAARLAAMLLLTLRGTPTLYNGDEIGMADVAIAPDEVHDPREKNEPGKGLGRDPQRTPMQWSDEPPAAGFTSGVPWLRLAADWPRRNVETLSGDARSILALYRHLTTLRRREAALHRGGWEPIDAGSRHVLAYARTCGARRLVVLLNFSSDPASIAAHLLPSDPVVLASTHMDQGKSGTGTVPLTLRPQEGLIVAPAA